MPFPLYGYQTISGAEINSADKGMVFCFRLPNPYLSNMYLSRHGLRMCLLDPYLCNVYLSSTKSVQLKISQFPPYQDLLGWSRFVRAIGAIIISPCSWLICSLSRGTIQSSVILTWDHGSVITSWIKVCFGLFWMVH